jgi:hypothetical protein
MVCESESPVLVTGGSFVSELDETSPVGGVELDDGGMIMARG